MRLLPRSLAGRLLATSVVAILVALAVASLAIGHVLGRFVTAGLDDRLDAQIAVVARAVRPDGSLDPARAIDVPPFDEPGSGWAWQATARGRTLRSASLGDGTIPFDPPSRLPPPPGDDLHPRPFEALAADGAPVHGRLLVLPGPIEIAAVAPRETVERPLRAATAPLLASVAVLGAALALAVLVQLRLGLRPLGRVQAMLADVRAGRRRHIAIEEPSELLPLVAELNALIDAGEAGLARARLHVANLAHGLKTPLATLRLDLAAPGRDPDGRLSAQVARLEEQVRHHLSRARAADRGEGAVPVVPLAPAIVALVAALERIHADRGHRADVAVPDGLAVRCDPQDLDEALGNLLDNAWRHACGRIGVTATADGRAAAIAIADDGPALPPGRLAALREGAVPADERQDGHGHGIRIARELIELHGGALDFAPAHAGGLVATIRLPLADPPRIEAAASPR